MSCSITSIIWVSIAECIQFEMLLLSAAFSIQLARKIDSVKHHQTQNVSSAPAQGLMWLFLFTLISSHVLFPQLALQQRWALAEVEQHLEMFQPLAEIMWVNTQGGLMLLVDTLRLTDGD